MIKIIYLSLFNGFSDWELSMMLRIFDKPTLEKWFRLFKNGIWNA